MTQHLSQARHQDSVPSPHLGVESLPSKTCTQGRPGVSAVGRGAVGTAPGPPSPANTLGCPPVLSLLCTSFPVSLLLPRLRSVRVASGASFRLLRLGFPSSSSRLVLGFSFLAASAGSSGARWRPFRFLSLLGNFFLSPFLWVRQLSGSIYYLEETKTPKHQGRGNKMDRGTRTGYQPSDGDRLLRVEGQSLPQCLPRQRGIVGPAGAP